MTKPRLAIPEPHRGSEPNTWANKTISDRLRNIASRVLEENQYAGEIVARLQALIDEIPQAPIRLLDDPWTPDETAWNRYLQPFLGQNWYQPPWFLVEHYFYRRILEATGYFQNGDGFSIDPFAYQKRTGLEVSRSAIHQLMSRIEAWLQQEPAGPEKLRDLLDLVLWGNQADLSMWPAEGDGKPDHIDLQQARSHILVDDALRTIDRILGFDPGHSRVDIVLDNAGFELICDLALADYFLTAGLASVVCLHVKAHPTYVSDAMEKDVHFTLRFLLEQGHPITKTAGERLQSYLDQQRLQMRENFFWTSPLDGWQMPDALREALSQSDLVISKGDANYRRWLGDRHWAFTTPFDGILSYFPAPLLALRTLKSELIPGLRPGQAESVALQDPDWLIDGRWGVLQYSLGSSSNILANEQIATL